jgi:glycosyltransferase involved in cell wall biosynthesis
MNISVVIPVYNQAEYLPDAIESVLAQTVKPKEIIVVNDGSTDDSLQVAKKYPVKVINQVNKGLPSARNTGIMNMKGTHFFPLDADDILKENCIEKLSEAIKEHNADVTAPSFKAFGVFNEDKILNGIPTIEDFKTGNRLPYFSVIKKSVLLSIGGYNPKMVYGYEDYDLWLDIFKRKHSLCVLQDILVLYRTKEKSMLTNSIAHHDELIAQMKLNHPTVYAEN